MPNGSHFKPENHEHTNIRTLDRPRNVYLNRKNKSFLAVKEVEEKK